MKVFLSWSGTKSQAVAVALRDWLPSVINELDPFVSAKDIAAGASWQTEIAGQLESTQFGIVRVTQQNQEAPWLNFEAGALAKAFGASRVVPLAIDLKVTDVRPPLAQFQAQELSRAGVQEVLRSLNHHCEKPLSESQLLKASDVWWPQLEPQITNLPSSGEADAQVVSRSERDLLEEILTTVRSLQAFSPADLGAATAFLNEIMAAFGSHNEGISLSVYEDGPRPRILVRSEVPVSRGLRAKLMRVAQTHSGELSFVTQAMDTPEP